MSENVSESEMNAKGYFKGKMCPFTVASVGGTTMITGSSSTESYEWRHFACMGEFCRLWDKEENDCSFKIMTEHIKKQ